MSQFNTHLRLSVIETFFAFFIWASAGSLMAMSGANPIQTALFRYFFAGLILLLVSVGFRFFRAPAQINQSIPWRDSKIWISGSLLVVGNIFFNISVTQGPIAIAGLAYGYIPLVIPLISLFFGLERRRQFSFGNWLGFALAFIGNYFLFQGFHKSGQSIGDCEISALIAATCFGLGPLFTAALQKRGMTDWALLRGQNATAMLIALPLSLGLYAFEILKLDDLALFKKSISAGVAASVVLTILPFYLWTRGIRKAGPGRTTIFVFLNPLIACLLSIFVVKDLPVNFFTASGIGLILVGVLLSFRTGTKVSRPLPRPLIQYTSAVTVGYPLLFPIIFGLLMGWDGERLLNLMLHPFHLLVIALSLVSGWTFFIMHRWAFPIFGLFIAAIAGEIMAFLEQSGNMLTQVTLPICLTFIGFLFVVGYKKIRRDHRVDLDLEVGIQDGTCEPIPAKLMNLSEGGCKLILNEMPENKNFNIGQKLILHFQDLGIDQEVPITVVKISEREIRAEFKKLNSRQRTGLLKLIEPK